ncbi:MEC1 [Candida theae]|uniref:Serine/threonine-protein kinase MEC1 n=1 Tax=Candida theae TaxID=1198502 RepID=A0AAD5BGJ1_9ASCO|nr:MEC1 [Candida theae]KAI5961667.1 MEC1 [Candida theae]
MAPVSKLSLEELHQFLSDIEANINDQETDFKKLILYLFQFLNAKLSDASLVYRKDIEDTILRIINTIELVLSKKLHLLNASLKFQEISSIHVTDSRSRLVALQEVLLYEWMISFLLSHIANVWSKRKLSDKLKTLLISVINLVSTRLHNFKFIKLLQENVTRLLENGISFCLNDISYSTNPDYIKKLISCCELYSVVSDYDISKKLSLNLSNQQLKYESFGRKLWFVLQEMSILNSDESLYMVDYYKSLLILTHLDNALLDEQNTWGKTQQLLTWVTNILEQDFEQINSTFNGSECLNLHQSVSLALFKIYFLCNERGIVSNFDSILCLDRLVAKAAMQSAFPLPVKCTLAVISTHIESNNPDLQLKNKIPIDFANYQYSNPELNELKAKLLPSSAVDTSLDFIVKAGLEYHETDITSNGVNDLNWIRHVRDLTKKYSKELEAEETMYTLITALGNFASRAFTKNLSTYDADFLQIKHSYSAVKKNRPPVKSTTESLILDEIVEKYFLSRMQIWASKPLLACNFFLMIYNYYANYLPSNAKGDVHWTLLDKMLNLLSTHRNRSLRMLIIRILPLYLIQETDDATLDRIFKHIFERITKIHFNSWNRRHFGESTIYALVELARVCNGERLCAVYFKLVDWLGEPNEQHSNYVYCGFLDIANSKNVSTYKLLSPYLPSMADVIIKKESLFEKSLSLLGLDRKYFLNRTKEFTVPKLLEYHKDPTLLVEVAEAANMPMKKLLAQNLPRILASYLVNNPLNDVYVLKVLSSVCPHYRSVSVQEIFTHIGDITWHILMEIQMDEKDNVRNLSNIISALETVAKNLAAQKNQRVQKGKMAGMLIEEQVLLLVQRFSDVTYSLRGAKPYLERRASFRAILYLIKNHSLALTSALGQLSTCLQASLEEPDFHILTLKCWNELVQKLPPAHLISLFDIIISLIFQKFQSFGPEAQRIAIDVLRKIYTEIKDKYNRYALYFLSIAFLDYMSDYGFVKEFKNIKPPSKLTIFQEFNRRLKTRNRYVVEQALFDLYNYCKKYQFNCQADYFKDPALHDTIAVLVRTVLDTATHFKNRSATITSQCAKVLAVMGALDANKFHFKKVKQSIVVQRNFDSTKENAVFLVDLIENYAMNIFWSSNDPQKQLFAAFAMQSFLTIMGITKESLKEDKTIWDRFSDVAKSTLTPFLSSRYSAPRPKLEQIEFPYFKSGMKFETWLIDVTLYLLKRASQYEKGANPNPRQWIFQTCAILIQKDHNISLCQHLFKYVVLNHILCLNHDVERQLLEEFQHLFEQDTKKMPNDRAEELKLCFQSVFSVFDYCNEWLSATRQFANYSVSSDVSTSEMWLDKLELVKKFLDSFGMDLIAIKSAECDSYERTILYIEKCYRDGHIDDKSFKLGELDASKTLQNMYASINDYDALNGVLKLFSTNNVKQKLASFQYNDNWSLALESFKVLGAGEDSSVEYNTKLLKALNEHGSYDDVLSTLSSTTDASMIQQIPLAWSLVALKSAVYSGKKDQLQKWLQVTDSLGKAKDSETVVSYELARYLQKLYNNESPDFAKTLDKLYTVIGSSLVSSDSSSFNKNISLMNQLHSLHDMGDILSSAGHNNDVLKVRFSNIDQDFEAQNKILTIHAVANHIIENEKQVSDIFLLQSSLARENDRLDFSTRSIVRAMALNNSAANIEFAKLLWKEGKQSEAIKTILEVLTSGRLVDNESKARVQLQYANWLDESNHLSAHQIVEEYTKAFVLDKEYEKASYDIGKYYNKLIESSKDTSGLYEHLTVRNFIRAVSIGSSFIFEALPKLITIWLDFAKRPNKTKSAERRLQQIIQDLNTGLKSVATYAWYTVITQILSRIVQAHEPSFKVMANVVSNIILEYPHHSLWYVLSHIHSTDPQRKLKVNTILESVKKSKKSHGVLISAASELFEKLIEIASKPISKSSRTKQLSLSKYFGVEDASKPYPELVIPVQSNLQIRLPSKGVANYVAFPKNASVTFDGFDDVVNIFFSLQMPRQVTIRGSDGNPYRLMVKADDTRKDAKVVEFTTMVNRILSTSTEARKRGLNVANYSVIPLSEKIGVIEFVMDVQTMKGIVNEQRKRLGKVVNERKIFVALNSAQKFIQERKPDETKLKHLVQLFTTIVQNNEPVLHQWFIEQFSDPSAWYIARNKFTRSAAVMSIVGYLVGLGDRHCENILFFKNTGAILHIDFDCLFEKGKTLPTPEIVPFRLTQNMVDAMGICGVDGSFRISCEETGQLLRNNEQSLMNILETLLYDPLLDWKNQDPQRDLMKVRKKIRGLMNEDEGLAMNIHGQVDVLIQEATSMERLAQMYGGWSAYI